MSKTKFYLCISEIEKAKQSCGNSNMSAIEHFVGADKLSKRANNAEVIIKNYKLTRYACYLIAQNGDSRKKVIAQAQAYFSVQTKKIESDHFTNLNYFKYENNLQFTFLNIYY